ncbi:hypothetical protein ACFWNN_37375 [Lentzea sp. NPDC058450]|uniref:hypothetical protein n=1 Tax=Lentzea sp. NPDC058450 TaxID=3346505 RepID=UPI0036513536
MKVSTFVSCLVALGTVGLGAAPASAEAAGVETMACRYAAYPPAKSGSNVVGWGEKWDCGGSVNWTLTVQKHLTGPWWQFAGNNFASGDGWLSAPAGCVSGTYRTILTSSSGHQTVGGHASITC